MWMMLQFKTIATKLVIPRDLNASHYVILKEVLENLKTVLESLNIANLLDNPTLQEVAPHIPPSYHIQ